MSLSIIYISRCLSCAQTEIRVSNYLDFSAVSSPNDALRCSTSLSTSNVVERHLSSSSPLWSELMFPVFSLQLLSDMHLKFVMLYNKNVSFYRIISLYEGEYKGIHNITRIPSIHWTASINIRFTITVVVSLLF